MLRRLVICVIAAMVLLPAALAFSNSGGPTYGGCPPGDTRDGNTCVAYALVTRTVTFVLPNFRTVTTTETKTKVVTLAGGTTTLPGKTTTVTSTLPGTTTTEVGPGPTVTETVTQPGTTSTDVGPGLTTIVTVSEPGSTATLTETETETTTTDTTETTTSTESTFLTP